jgi:aldehyde dehydrogenase (NAD+)
MEFLKNLGIKEKNFGSSTGAKWNKTMDQGELKIYSPATGEYIASVYKSSEKDYDSIILTAQKAFKTWRQLPAPKRGDIVRQIGLKLREYKKPLGMLVSYEMGKSLQEGWGEVQEMIDICDYAVGQSRQLYGFTMQSERPEHRMYDQYHPLGIVATISAPLTAIACQNIIAKVIKENDLPEGVFSLIVGSGRTIGEKMLNDKRIPLLSLTGSTKVGRHAAQVISRRLGKYILELGGNNGIILTPAANLKIAIPSIVFGAVGTAGQRCTTTRRLIVHESIYDQVKKSLLKAYGSLSIGNPMDENNHMGPLIDKDAVKTMMQALDKVKNEGGKILVGGEKLSGKGYESDCYVTPAIVEAENRYDIVQEETFAPILYLIKYSGEVEEGIALHNDVVQGLSSAIFTNNILEAETFLSYRGSDCGIANVNIGTSGAEIGGAFGGEKDTGGGRESGSDAWKAYMRRQTNTINFGKELPLAQGIKFDV